MDQHNKHDAGKARVDLLPSRALLAAAHIFAYGATKYEEWSWRRVDDWENRYYASTFRHLLAWRGGKRIDPESGQSHLAHALANLLIMVDYEEGISNGTKTNEQGGTGSGREA